MSRPFRCFFHFGHFFLSFSTHNHSYELIMLMNLDIFRTYGSHSIRRLFDLILERRMTVLTVDLERHFRRFTLVQPFIKGFHPSSAHISRAFQ